MIGGWPETGFLRDPSLRWEDSGKNPVSLMVREGPETGFLRDTLLQPVDLGKNPVSLVREGPETGFLRDTLLQPTNSGKNPVSSNFVLIPAAGPLNRSSSAKLKTSLGELSANTTIQSGEMLQLAAKY